MEGTLLLSQRKQQQRKMQLVAQKDGYEEVLEIVIVSSCRRISNHPSSELRVEQHFQLELALLLDSKVQQDQQLKQLIQ